MHTSGDQPPSDGQETPAPQEDGPAGQQIVGDNRGTVIGVQNVHTGDDGYDVRGLASPYLGLAAFTYAERDRYAGREGETKQAVSLITQPGLERTLHFVTGASGSGKSSFAQAAVLPALEAHYQQEQFSVAWAVLRPGAAPMAALARAWRTLGLPAEGVFAERRTPAT